MKMHNRHTVRSALIAGALCALTIGSAASAQTFTYKSTANPPAMTVGGTAPDGRSFGANGFSGTSDATMGGKTMTSSFKCIEMTQPANDQIFNAHMMCDVAVADGTYTSAWGCTIVGKDEQSCVGRLIGLTGVYAKRFGTITGHAKGTMSSGTGQWDN